MTFGPDRESAYPPCLWLMDLDPDPAQESVIFVIDLQDANKKQYFSKFFCLLVFEGAFT